MSGIEIAGLALGIFPLVMKAIAGYAEGCQKIDDMRHHRVQLKNFKLELDTEYTKFYNTCEKLLQEFDDIPSSHVQAMLVPSAENDGSVLWGSSCLKDAMYQKLNDRTVTSFLENVNAMNFALQELSDYFPVDADTKKPFARKYVKKVFKAMTFTMLKDMRSESVVRVRNINADLATLVLGGARTDGGTNTKRQAARAVKFYHRVRKQACDLFSVFKDKLEPSTCVCAGNHSVGLRMDLRDVDKSISGFNQDTTPIWNSEKDPVKFRTFITLTAFDTDNEWREADVELEDEVPDDDEGVSVEYLPTNGTGHASPAFHHSSKSFSGVIPAREETIRDKSTLQVASAECDQPRSPLGSKRKSLMRNLKVGFSDSWMSSRSTNFCSTSLSSSITITTTTTKSDSSFNLSSANSTQITLTGSEAHSRVPSPPPLPSHIDIPDLTSLCSPHLTSFASPFCHISRRHRIYPTLPSIPPAKTTTLHDLFLRHYPLSVKERFQLALKLASSVLQLHSSGWLRDSWSSKDIEFLEGPSGVIVDSPLSMVRLQKKVSSQQPHQSRLPVQCNRTLVSLGIVLIELCHNRSLEDPWLQAQCKQSGNTETTMVGLDDETRRYDLAWRLLGSLADNASPGYEDAARRCITRLDCRYDDLKNDEYGRAMYESVLGPLKKTLERFRGEE